MIENNLKKEQLKKETKQTVTKPTVTKPSTYIILEVKGGCGKNVIATQLVKSISKKYPERKIIVISGWDTIWLNSPYIYRCYNYNQLNYFYDDFMNEDTVVYKEDPYNTDDYIHARKDLITIWHEMYNLPITADRPELFITQLELSEFAQRINYNEQQKIMIIHPYGSGQNEPKYSWYRDIHPQISIQIVEHYKQQGYRIIQPRMDHQLNVEGAEQFTTNNQRDLILLTLLSSKRLLIDSVMQHIAAAAQKESTVVFATKRQHKIFGHDIHDNIVSGKISKNICSKYMVYEEFNFSGSPVEYPLAPNEMMYDVKELIKSIDKQK